ncbi:hypothetical protein F0562_015570 [Nyssa sinensis]|uniref:DUF4005 domain-containing protein n=1 Tax=Nyssa sinensis TaxID=561372 RepID=A0A5J4ZKJ8_9ASTE|nr:hypothetical protein F0562_015570 [Nyssa sinensis]
MGKKRSWFSLVKRLFVSETKPKADKKSKRWRCVFGRLKFRQYPALSAPQRTLSEATEEQRKHALAVAIATAAAAEAAVAAAHAAAEVVWLTGVPQSYDDYQNRIQNLAAIKIQSSYRAHLARKALRALKGLVRLQAIIRGQIVRRQVITNLKCLPSIAKTESQAHQLTVPNVDESCKDGEKKQFLSPKKELEEKEIKLESKSQKNWDCSLFSKEDMETSWSRKQEAIIKRERMRRYSFSHRERRNYQTLREAIGNEHWADDEAYKKRDKEKLKSTVLSNLIDCDTDGAQIKLRKAYKHDSAEELNSRVSLPRRSFCHAKQKSIGEDSSLPNSPVFPTYMVATESVKAKARSISMPKQRLGFLDTCSDHSSPFKLRSSPWSSFNGEGTSTDGQSTDISQQISIQVKGLYPD